MGNTRNLLIVGRTNCGKSTLANVLTGTEHFPESENTVRNTEDFHEETFELEGGTEYHVVDIRVRPTEIHNKIKKIINSIPKGISQVLYVIDERFTAEEIKTFELYEKAILQSNILRYTTIVRTKFINFKNGSECNKDKEGFCDESKKIAEIIKLCRGVVYVDNPPIANVFIASDSDDNVTIENNKRRRDRSRAILLDHLEKVCQGEYYKLKIWDNNKLLDKITESAEPISESLIKEINRSLKESVPKFVEAIKKDKKEKKSLRDRIFNRRSITGI